MNPPVVSMDDEDFSLADVPFANGIPFTVPRRSRLRLSPIGSPSRSPLFSFGGGGGGSVKTQPSGGLETKREGSEPEGGLAYRTSLDGTDLTSKEHEHLQRITIGNSHLEEDDEGEEEEDEDEEGEEGYSPVSTMGIGPIGGDSYIIKQEGEDDSDIIDGEDEGEEREVDEDDIDNCVEEALRKLEELRIKNSKKDKKDKKDKKNQHHKIHTALLGILIRDVYTGGGRTEDILKELKRACQRTGTDPVAFLNNSGTTSGISSKITPGNDEDDLPIFILNVTEHIIPQELEMAEYYEACELGDEAVEKWIELQKTNPTNNSEYLTVRVGTKEDPTEIVPFVSHFVEEAILNDW